jgi:methyl-accepting chemotaxis protein
MVLSLLTGRRKAPPVVEVPQINPELIELREQVEQSGKVTDAIARTLAVIEFKMDGTIQYANDLFTQTTGYALDEIVGKHHRMFCERKYADSHEYSSMWARLRAGDALSGEFHRLGKGNRNIWLRASYIPIRDSKGMPVKVIKYAFDVTHDKLANAEFQAQISSIHQTQAVIEFNLDGTVITANQNFVNALGYYSIDEIRGKHHRIFCDDSYANSHAYIEFWNKLNSGKSHSGEFMRLSKNRKPIWINASYNPIFDPTGKLTKVIKFATDITASVNARDTMASSISQMAETISEISKNINLTTSQAGEARNLVNDTSVTIESLKESSHKIGEITSLIGELAEQTNLLALNATIEAARAGESGKGFAVVASEVKTLALETREATQNISESVNEIRNRISQIVNFSVKITDKVSDVSNNMMSVSSAVEEQSVTMAQLRDSVERMCNQN